MKQSFSLRFLFVLAWMLAVTFLAACSAEPEVEPTPILPPPNVHVGEIGTPGGGGHTAVSPTLVPGEMISGTAVSTTDATLQLTPTLEATATATSTPGATPVTDPPVQAITSGTMPAASRDLLFLADGAFKRWNHNTGQIEVLLPGPVPSSRIREDASQSNPVVGDLTDFSVSADGQRAVIARLTASTPITRTNTAGEGHQYPDIDTQHELWFMDLVSNQTWRIVSRVDNLGEVALSADARHVAFQGASLDGGYAMQESGEPILHVYFLPTGGGTPGPITDVAACEGFCGSLAWHPDNNLFVWNDSTAVWLQNLAAQESEQLIQNHPFDEQTADVGQTAVYLPISWAHNGRYLLLAKGGWEGSGRTVFDVPTRALVDVPDTWIYANIFPPEVSWMPDDRLLLLRSEEEVGQVGRPQMELWRFQPDQNAIVQEETVVLSNQNWGAAGAQHLSDGRFAYVLFSDQPHLDAGAYHLTSFSETPERINASPPVQFWPGAAMAVWSEDGYGVMMSSTSDGRVYYAQAEGDYLYDVTAVLGAEPHAFHWQPEIVPPQSVISERPEISSLLERGQPARCGQAVRASNFYWLSAF